MPFHFIILNKRKKPNADTSYKRTSALSTHSRCLTHCMWESHLLNVRMTTTIHGCELCQRKIIFPSVRDNFTTTSQAALAFQLQNMDTFQSKKAVYRQLAKNKIQISYISDCFLSSATIKSTAKQKALMYTTYIPRPTISRHNGSGEHGWPWICIYHDNNV